MIFESLQPEGHLTHYPKELNMIVREVFNVTKSLLHPKRFSVIAEKLVQRFRSHRYSNEVTNNLKWLEDECEPFADFANGIDPELWQESLDYAKDLETLSSNILSSIPVKLGGGGFYPLLYFITRRIKPSTIVESGVALGYSSHAFLSALDKNQACTGSFGKLYSSDFPYFRLENPEQYIGLLVPKELRENWTLLIDGDAINLHKITQQVSHIEIFHYDSDKSYFGRERALKQLENKMTPESIIIMDDINDNSFFKDWCNKKGNDYKVFKFNNKYIGLYGKVS